MIDFKKLKQIYNFGNDLTLADLLILFKSAKSLSFKKGDNLINEGDLKKNVFYIRKGLVRAYVVNDKGDEITTMIRSENQVMSSVEIILFNKPSPFYCEALEPTEVYHMDYDVIEKLIFENPRLERNRKFFHQNIIKESYQRINSFVLLSPEERYLEFVKSNPDIVNRVPGKYIANVLGITPVSLSRIRKRIASK